MSLSSTVQSIEDTYVRDGVGTSVINHGNEGLLELKKDGIGFSREVFLKFDVSSLPATFSSAKLRLKIGTTGSSVASTNWQVYYVPSDIWTEDGINWDNKPTRTDLVASIQGQASGIAEWDITTKVLAEKSVDNILSLVIVSSVSDAGSYASFSSGETANAPKITVEYVLPFSLTDFSGNVLADKQILKLFWTTYEELNVNRYEVEVSRDARNFTKTGEVQPLNKAEKTSYEFECKPATGEKTTMFCRLKMIDNDGSFHYSSVLAFILKRPVRFSAFPNPAHKQININVSEAKGFLRLVDFSGNIIRQIPVTKTNIGIELQGIPPGMYLLQHYMDTKIISNEKIIVE